MIKIKFILAFILVLLYGSLAQAQTLTTTDSLLNTGAGNATVVNNLPFGASFGPIVCNPGFVNAGGGSCFNGPSATNEKIWQLHADWFAGSGSGTGSLTAAYGVNGTPNGTATFTVSATGTSNISGVSGYPNLTYGTPFGENINGQPPQFPFLLIPANQFKVDATYALTGSITGQNNDVLWDEWISNSAITTKTEVAILTYQDFVNPLTTAGTGTCSGFVQSFTQTITINGTPTPIAFLEYDTAIKGIPPCGSSSPPYGGGYGVYGDTVWFFWPGTAANVAVGYSSGEIAFDTMPFEREALARLQVDFGTATINAAGPWKALGNQLGSEWGHTTAPSFTFTISKMQIQTYAGPIVSLSPASLSFGSLVNGFTSASQTITLQNTGGDNLTMTSVALTGANAAEFNIVSNTCTGTIAVNATCTTVVTFTPNAGSNTSFNANVTYTTNAVSSPDSVAMSGVGISFSTPPVAPVKADIVFMTAKLRPDNWILTAGNSGN